MDDRKSAALQPTENVDSVIAVFEGRKELLATLCARTKNLIEECLEGSQIRYQSVQARVKSTKKLREKYTDPAKGYTDLGDITDLAGLRIITYYEDEVDQVAELIRGEFEIDEEKSVDKRNTSVDGFSYHAVNYVCRYSVQRRTSVEYRKFAAISFEIQITSILRHAWAEIEHSWYDLKEAFPPEIRRRFYRMAALLEVAESEFLELRNKRKGYERSVAVQIEANVVGIPINAVTMASFIDQDPLVSEINGNIASILGAPSIVQSAGQGELASHVAKCLGVTAVETLRNLLQKHQAHIVEFSKLSMPLVPRKPGASLTQVSAIFRLGVLLIASRGGTALSEFLTDVRPLTGYATDADPKELADIAKKILADA
jgi:ppGpp synthetase/RelA/SpoT-type nucleotidyltranferase